MFPINSAVSATGSLFSQPDLGSAYTVTEAPFELPEILQVTIEEAINTVADPECVMSTQDVLETHEEFCMQQVVPQEQIDAMLKANC